MNKLSNEDIEFLKDLQHELLTQENDCQADPRFWAVAENKRDFGYDPDYADGEVMCGCDGETWDTPEEFLEFLIENEYIKRGDIKEDYDYDFSELLELVDDCDFYTCGYRDNFDVITPDTMFITKKSCQEHIAKNGYHYKQPHTYAMTAWRNPEIERLYKILKEIDWDSINNER